MTRIEYRCSVSQKHGADAIAVERVLPDTMTPQGMTISFQRTIRVPDNGSINQLPPNLGAFPLFKVQDYVSRLPEEIALKGGVFFPMHQKEAMWISFSSDAPFMVKLYVGGVNAISGEHSEEDDATKKRRMELKKNNKTIQDYMVLPIQPWVDGITVDAGKVRQFVAMPIGQGYTVEAQITGKEVTGGLQFEITPARYEYPRPSQVSADDGLELSVKAYSGKTIHCICSPGEAIGTLKRRIEDHEGIPPYQQRLIFAGKELGDAWTIDSYKLQTNSTLHLVLGLRGGGGNPELGISPGGHIAQDIRKDPYSSQIWVKNLNFTIPVHILNSASFRSVTGMEPPPCPIGAQTYANAGLPFFNLYEEHPSDVSGADAFAPIKSVNKIEQAKSLADGAEAVVLPRMVNLRHGGDLGRVIWADGEEYHVDDADGLLSPDGPHREFRTLADLEAEVEQLALSDSADSVKMEDPE